MNPMPQDKTSEQLRREWVEHPHFKYRGCAPDPDDPLRMAGDPSLHIGAHHGPDAFAPEGQRERRVREERAIEVCLGCPVMVACDRYASSVTPDGRLAEPEGVWGGRRSLERHKALIAARVAVTAAPDRVFQTVQKQAVLAALAQCWEPFEVAAVAGMDVRTANWQRSQLVRLLGLPKSVSRMRLLAVARERGLLAGVRVVPDDGTVPAVAPPTRLPPVEAPAAVVLPLRRPRRSHTAVMPGQLSFESLFPSSLGAAA
ncbi:WhiB family transcriptional regulator [Streptomyces griseofuscus]|uniref:WhiB family transcriptional regulator n=1 Tax=Streptomyces griseofuscus TaxID=146922 RepID=UPI0036C109BA